MIVINIYEYTYIYLRITPEFLAFATRLHILHVWLIISVGGDFSLGGFFCVQIIRRTNGTATVPNFVSNERFVRYSALDLTIKAHCFGSLYLSAEIQSCLNAAAAPTQIMEREMSGPPPLQVQFILSSCDIMLRAICSS